MKIEDVRRTAYSMPLTNPSFPPGPYRFYDREYFIITYKTDPEALAAVVPEPLEVAEPVVKYEFIRMPDSTGFPRQCVCRCSNSNGVYTGSAEVQCGASHTCFLTESGVVFSAGLNDEG